MAGGGSGDARAAVELRWMRGSTAATLWLLILIGGFLQLLGGIDGAFTPRTGALVAGTIVSIVLASAAVPSALQPSVSSVSSAHRPLIIALLAAAGGTWLIALTGPFAGWAWGYLLAVAGGLIGCLVRGWRSAVVLIGTLCALMLGVVSSSLTGTGAAGGSAVAAGGVGDVVIVSTLVLMTFMPLSAVVVLRVVLRLEDARRTASEFAVASERLRFATDLHDIQGHHLQVIALKGELAERRFRSGESALAAEELADIRRIAQTALDDTRALVNGYRTVTIAVEARNAADVLRSAGIECEARIDGADLPAPIGEVLAVAIREAATNILRHRRATSASFELVQTTGGECRLTVTNDGSRPPRTGGTGLIGLGERVSAWNGTVQTRRDGDTFVLIVRMPVSGTAQRAGAER